MNSPAARHERAKNNRASHPDEAERARCIVALAEHSDAGHGDEPDAYGGGRAGGLKVQNQVLQWVHDSPPLFQPAKTFFALLSKRRS